MPLACRCIGQGTTGAGGFAKALRTVPVVLEIADRCASAPHRRLDRRLHEPGRHRHALAARCRSSRGRPLQRRDRIPALDRGRSTASSRAVLVDQVGLNHLTWIRRVLVDGSDVPFRACSASTVTRSPSRSSSRAPGRGLGSSSPYLHASIATTRSRSQREGTPRAARVAEIERGLLELYRDPGARREARPARAARRRVLQRSRHCPRRLACSAVPATSGGRRPQRRVRSPGWLTTTSSSSRRVSGRAAPCRCRSRRSPQASGPRSARRRRRAAHRRTAVSGDPVTARKAAARPLIGQYRRVESSSSCCARAERTAPRGSSV